MTTSQQTKLIMDQIKKSVPEAKMFSDSKEENLYITTNLNNSFLTSLQKTYASNALEGRLRVIFHSSGQSFYGLTLCYDLFETLSRLEDNFNRGKTLFAWQVAGSRTLPTVEEKSEPGTPVSVSVTRSEASNEESNEDVGYFKHSRPTM